MKDDLAWPGNAGELKPDESAASLREAAETNQDRRFT
jgi:hypothetical protein